MPADNPIPPAVKIAAALWVGVWLPVYALSYGWANFLHLSDLSVGLTAIGLWWESSLLISSQAVGLLLAELLWMLDVAGRLLVGVHVIGGTEYLWDARFPLWLRLMTLYHLALPVVWLWALARLGYDRRGWKLQLAISAAALIASRASGAAENLNFAFRDPFLHRSWGPAPLHVALMLAGLLVVGMLPTHWVLRKLFARRVARC